MNLTRRGLIGILPAWAIGLLGLKEAGAEDISENAKLKKHLKVLADEVERLTNYQDQEIVGFRNGFFASIAVPPGYKTRWIDGIGYTIDGYLSRQQLESLQVLCKAWDMPDMKLIVRPESLPLSIPINREREAFRIMREHGLEVFRPSAYPSQHWRVATRSVWPTSTQKSWLCEQSFDDPVEALIAAEPLYLKWKEEHAEEIGLLASGKNQTSQSA